VSRALVNRDRWLCLVMLTLTFPAVGQMKEIIGYYPSWKWSSRNNLVTPERIPYEKLTIINYAFFFPLPDGSMVGRDTIGDNLYLKGNSISGIVGNKPGSTLPELAHRNGVKVLLSVGGWEDSNNFPEVAAHKSKRTQFAHSCIEQIQKFGFDGIDIDWEYPCYVDHKGTPDDKLNFTLLLQVVRDSLTAFEKKAGKKLILTAALPAFASGAANFQMDEIAGILDEFNIMAYDFCGPWDSQSGHNAPLYPPNAIDTVRNVDAAFRLYTVTHKVPAGKINIGIPFYSHTFAHCTSMYSSHTGADTVHFSRQGCFYYDVVQCMSWFERFWDDRAKVPYLVSQDWNMLISYDDEESVALKAQYVLDRNAGGVIIWEITGDYLPDGSTPLLDAISSKFHGSDSIR
jgi:chitinase